MGTNLKKSAIICCAFLDPQNVWLSGEMGDDILKVWIAQCGGTRVGGTVSKDEAIERKEGGV